MISKKISLLITTCLLEGTACGMENSFPNDNIDYDEFFKLGEEYASISHVTDDELKIYRKFEDKIHAHNKCCFIDNIIWLPKTGFNTDLKILTNINAKNNEGKTLLHYVASFPVVNVGYNHEDKFGIRPSDVYWTDDNAEKLMLTLIKQGADVNAQDNDGNTPLHLSINCQLLNCLLNNGANQNITNENGQTPLFAQCAQCCGSFDNELLLHGLYYSKSNTSQFQQDIFGNTALHVFVNNENFAKESRFAKRLINDEFPLNLKNKKGETILFLLLIKNKIAITDGSIKELMRKIQELDSFYKLLIEKRAHIYLLSLYKNSKLDYKNVRNASQFLKCLDNKAPIQQILPLLKKDAHNLFIIHDDPYLGFTSSYDLKFIY